MDAPAKKKDNKLCHDANQVSKIRKKDAHFLFGLILYYWLGIFSYSLKRRPVSSLYLPFLGWWLLLLILVGGDCTNWEMKSIGTGKTMVEFFSAAMELRVCKYLS